jgi:S1-C subfamily serine protease
MEGERDRPMIEPLLLTATPIHTFEGEALLTNASGFFFERDERLFLVTSRHVVSDASSGHFPDRLGIELHVDPDNMALAESLSIPLYEDGAARWRQGVDAGGEVDVAAIEIDREALPEQAVIRAFTPRHLCAEFDLVEVGSSVLILGFPLGFHDTLHHMPVARQGVVASSFGLRFQGQGYFLTDARTHRGTSGAPVVARVAALEAEQGDLPWTLLGVHSARLDVGRDQQQDEALGLNLAWYADILLTLTEG